MSGQCVLVKHCSQSTVAPANRQPPSREVTDRDPIWRGGVLSDLGGGDQALRLQSSVRATRATDQEPATYRSPIGFKGGATGWTGESHRNFPIMFTENLKYYYRTGSVSRATMWPSALTRRGALREAQSMVRSSTGCRALLR